MLRAGKRLRYQAMVRTADEMQNPMNYAGVWVRGEYKPFMSMREARKNAEKRLQVMESLGAH